MIWLCYEIDTSLEMELSLLNCCIGLAIDHSDFDELADIVSWIG